MLSSSTQISWAGGWFLFCLLKHTYIVFVLFATNIYFEGNESLQLIWYIPFHKNLLTQILKKYMPHEIINLLTLYIKGARTHLHTYMYIFLSFKWKIKVYASTLSLLTYLLTHLITYLLICLHNALVSYLTLVQGFLYFWQSTSSSKRTTQVSMWLI